MGHAVVTALCKTTASRMKSAIHKVRSANIGNEEQTCKSLSHRHRLKQVKMRQKMSKEGGKTTKGGGKDEIMEST